MDSCSPCARSTKWVPIRIIFKPGYEHGYNLSGNLEIEPDSVKISGPKSIILPIHEWLTTALVLSNLKNSYEGFLKLKKTAAAVDMTPEKVRIKVPIEQVTEKILFVKIELKNATQEYRLFPSKVRLICNVGLSQFNALTSADFKAEVDLSNATTQNGNTLPIMVNLKPTIIANLRFEPKVVEFYVVEK